MKDLEKPGNSELLEQLVSNVFGARWRIVMRFGPPHCPSALRVGQAEFEGGAHFRAELEQLSRCGLVHPAHGVDASHRKRKKLPWPKARGGRFDRRIPVQGLSFHPDDFRWHALLR